jgi:uncharacterized protein
MKKYTLILSVLIVCATRSLAQSTDAAPIVLGHVDTLRSTILGEDRILNIYLPEGYSPDSAYPVIYLLDGALQEDFIHIAGLVQFSSFSWVNHVKPSILVGIANTDRQRDMTFSAATAFEWPKDLAAWKPRFPTAGGSAKFMDFIEKELQPYITGTYSTNGHKTLIGQSLAGLQATEILLKRPALFTDYIIMSPSLWWNNELLLKEAPSLLKNLPETPMTVYIGVGKEGKTMESDARNLAKAVKKAGKHNLNLQFEFLPDEDHGTILHEAVANAFEWRSKL